MLKRGKYINNIRFGDYIVSKFNPHLFDKIWFSGFGCGRTALSLLTGIPPNKFPEQKNYKDLYMVRELMSRNFITLPITIADVSQTPQFIASHIKDNHVVLTSQMAIKGEATWSVLFGGYVFHNFAVESLQPLELLNRPLLSAYLIYNKKWI